MPKQRVPVFMSIRLNIQRRINGSIQYTNNLVSKFFFPFFLRSVHSFVDFILLTFSRQYSCEALSYMGRKEKKNLGSIDSNSETEKKISILSIATANAKLKFSKTKNALHRIRDANNISVCTQAAT